MKKKGPVIYQAEQLCICRRQRSILKPGQEREAREDSVSITRRLHGPGGRPRAPQRCFMAADQEFIFAARPQASFAVTWALEKLSLISPEQIVFSYRYEELE